MGGGRKGLDITPPRATSMCTQTNSYPVCAPEQRHRGLQTKMAKKLAKTMWQTQSKSQEYTIGERKVFTEADAGTNRDYLRRYNQTKNHGTTLLMSHWCFISNLTILWCPNAAARCKAVLSAASILQSCFACIIQKPVNLA